MTNFLIYLSNIYVFRWTLALNCGPISYCSVANMHCGLLCHEASYFAYWLISYTCLLLVPPVAFFTLPCEVFPKKFFFCLIDVLFDLLVFVQIFKALKFVFCLSYCYFSCFNWYHNMTFTQVDFVPDECPLLYNNFRTDYTIFDLERPPFWFSGYSSNIVALASRIFILNSVIN